MNNVQIIQFVCQMRLTLHRGRGLRMARPAAAAAAFGNPWRNNFKKVISAFHLHMYNSLYISLYRI